MPYVANGAMQEGRPITVQAKELFLTLLNLIVLFFQTVFTTSPIATHMQQYKSTTRPTGSGGGGRPGMGGTNIQGVPKPGQYGGSAGG